MHIERGERGRRWTGTSLASDFKKLLYKLVEASFGLGVLPHICMSLSLYFLAMSRGGVWRLVAEERVLPEELLHLFLNISI